eukprot:TRINITY_DN34416_c0_g1_i1.p1 TRINITY_DN34416_c0_g1~~TRINITY_DN34416_c0_g1_i1.p1  ORF type:complete len:406 (-),score=124.37 TRINITY_DN34416_c0_g1_i1:8-1153(-)
MPVVPLRIAAKRDPPTIAIEYTRNCGRVVRRRKFLLEPFITRVSDAKSVAASVSTTFSEWLGPAVLTKQILERVIQQALPFPQSPEPEEEEEPVDNDMIYGDLNKASDAELSKAKESMEKDFSKNAVSQDDPNYIYDKQVEFKTTAVSEWDSEDESSDDNTAEETRNMMKKSALPPATSLPPISSNSAVVFSDEDDNVEELVTAPAFDKVEKPTAAPVFNKPPTVTPSHPAPSHNTLVFSDEDDSFNNCVDFDEDDSLPLEGLSLTQPSTSQTAHSSALHVTAPAALTESTFEDSLNGSDIEEVDEVVEDVIDEAEEDLDAFSDEGFEDDEDEPRPQSTLAADAFSGKLDKLGADAPLAFSDDDISDGGFAQDDVDDDDIW